MQKRKNQMAHARKRAIERFNIPLSQKSCNVIANKIRSQDPTCIRLKVVSFAASVWRIEWEGQELIVVYDRTTNALVTVLTEDMWKNQRMNSIILSRG